MFCSTIPRVQATLGGGVAQASQWVLQTHAWQLSVASGGTFPGCEVWKVPHGPGMGPGKALPQRAKGGCCMHTFREAAVPPMHKSCLVDISIRLITGSGRLWETPSGWRSPESTRAGGMAVSTGPGSCQSLTPGKLNPGSDMPTGEDWGSRSLLTLRRVHIASAGVLETRGPSLPIPHSRMSMTLAPGRRKEAQE